MHKEASQGESSSWRRTLELLARTRCSGGETLQRYYLHDQPDELLGDLPHIPFYGYNRGKKSDDQR